jgi:hypothetical protein
MRKTVAFALLAMLSVARPASAAVEAVPTFHSIGIAWSDSGGGADVECDVEYRPQGATEWKSGLPLWFDPRAVGSGTPAARPAGEYRGSLVYLTPGTAYELRLSLKGKSITTTTVATTWSESFPVGTTTTVADGASTLEIKTGGTKSGYALYAGPATIDVGGKQDHDVFIDAPYVVVRGLTLRGAATNAIELGPNAHDVVIEGNDISGFGVISTEDGAGTLWGSQSNAALYCNHHPSVERIVFQRNKVHHPRSDSNSWEEPRPSRGGDPHPLGPQAVTFESCGGNHVFRYNEVWSDADHYFQDAFGGGENFSFEGFPRNDSDIYGNAISQCWDDGIESEGGNRNVRIWNNYIDQTFVKIATAASSVGPIYIFRNVGNVSRRSPSTDPATVDGEDRGPFFKMGSNDSAYRNGRIFAFHNTALQPSDAKYSLTLGVGYGFEDSGGALTAVVSRNNILQNHKTNWDSVGDSNASPSNDFDYDLYNGKITAVAGSESHGIKAVPQYAAGNPKGVWALDEKSPGFDVGQKLPNFNDDFVGAGPDMGAFEKGGAPIEWGVDAGTADAVMPDGGSDAAAAVDGAVVDDAGSANENSPSATDDGGCSCALIGARGRAPAHLSLLGLLWVVARRRSRRHRDVDPG